MLQFSTLFLLLSLATIQPVEINQKENEIQSTYKLSNSELSYFMYSGEISNQAYDSTKNTIKILYKNGEIKDITAASDHLNIQALSKPVFKYYLCYPKK